MEWWEIVKNRRFIEETENEANRQKTRAERLTFVYFTYQLLIFSSISGGLPAVSEYWWVPFCFSLSLTVVFFLVFIDAVTGFHKIQGRLDLTRMEQSQQTDFCSKTYTTDPIDDVPRSPEEVRYREIKRGVFLTVVVGLLVAFAVVMLLGCWLILPPHAAAGAVAK